MPTSYSQAHLNTRNDDDGSRKGDKGNIGIDLYTQTLDAAHKSFDRAPRFTPMVSKSQINPMIAQTGNKGKNIKAMEHEIESVYNHGINKLYDDEQMELTKLNAIQKQIALEEEQINLQRIQNQQRKSEKILQHLRAQKQNLVIEQFTDMQSSFELPQRQNTAYRGQPMELFNKVQQFEERPEAKERHQQSRGTDRRQTDRAASSLDFAGGSYERNQSMD